MTFDPTPDLLSNVTPRQVVLLSERDDALRRALGRALSFSGFSVIPVPDLPRAAAYIEEGPDAGHDGSLPDVIVTDVPSWGSQRDAALSLVRRLSRRVPIVVLANGGDFPFFGEGRASPMIEVLEKPVAPQDLQAAVLRVHARLRYH
ncbi:MAG TPA: hypothetical protein VH142_16145 [Polyangiaceae bacterium]|jgi:CheY-like chemotaxis protein|nr:hypothetical protein [Polyangiaceae bacterium]